ncbi:unnamed protein product [Calypogeia fissa]
MRGLEAKGQLVVAVLLMLVAAARGGRLLKYHWTVDYSWDSPDCVERLIIAVNGLYPGPVIRAKAGDTVEVKVHNLMPTESVSIHWHGILQKGTPWADGAAFVSQCPIAPGETYTYKFKVTQPGTYFYHGHNGMQRAAGLYGSLIVDLPYNETEPFYYDGEMSILLNDWWHKSMYEQELGLVSNPFRWVGDPQSLLINGRGSYPCSNVSAATVSSGDCLECNQTVCPPYVLQPAVEPGKTYRLRIGSVASLSALNFILEGHNMTVVEVSGHYVQPVMVQNLDIYSGQTYSVLFTANQDPTHNYWAAVNVRGRNNTFIPTGVAILNYNQTPNTSLPSTPHPVSPVFNDFNLSLANAQAYKALLGSYGYERPPTRTADRQLFLLNTQNKLDGFTRWAVNNITYFPTTTPVLAALKYKMTEELVNPPPDSYTPGYDIYAQPNVTNPNTTAGSGVYIFKLNDVVDVILQNANTMVNLNSEIHPWHLHGHDFWVLGYGLGVFNYSTNYGDLNFVNPIKANTAPVLPYGWTALRFVANNPGAWPFHCHIEPHFHIGMGVIFAEGVHHLPAIPAENLGCGFTKRFLHLK